MGNNAPPCVMGAALTKREMFALRAPAAPDWFAAKWAEANGGDSTLIGIGLFVREAGPEQRLVITNAGKEAMYFAWRTYYADSLLAELAKGAAS